MALEIGGNWHCVVRDGHGDITDVIRMSDEAVVWSAEPLGFDTSIVLDELPVPFPLRGFGQLFDCDTDLVYQRARYYAPHEGRFLTPDPIGPAGGPNPYSYCLNQPLLWVDPLGLNPCLSREECDRIRERIQRHSAEVSARWNEMRYPKQILPFTGLTRAQGRRAAGKAVAPGAQGAPNFGTKGTVESHLPPYDDAQRGLNDAFQEYDRGQCHKHETKGDRSKVRRAREFRNKRPELHPDYGKKGPLPASLQGRVTIAKG
jgi:RHS repeat-associated protein